MGDNLTKDIFSYFEEKPIEPVNANVIGVDFGDGELVVVSSSIDTATGKLKVEPLMIDSNTQGFDYAVLHCPAKGDSVELGKHGSLKKGGKLYANYKTLPSRADEVYDGQAGGQINLSEPRKRELMGKSFAKLVQKVLDNNEILDQQEIYLFVGRPSSTRWASEAKEYREILKSGLPDDRNYHVMIISEALAAMANEYRKAREWSAVHKKGWRRDLSRMVAVIFDGGSSTFDCVVVKGGKILCEYSRQIGAGMLDSNLLDLYVFGKNTVREKDADGHAMKWSARQRMRREDFAAKDRKNKPLYSSSEGASLVGVREAKERYYGPDGTAANPTVSYVLARTIEAVEDSPEYNEKFARQSAPIKKFIDVAVNEMSVLVKASYPIEENDAEHCGEDYEYESFAAGVESFFKGAKAKWESVGATPQVVIMTGGATYMPFVGELMNKVIEPDKNNIKVVDEKLGDRHYAVADGVGYMGYLELYKEQIYREVCAKADEILKNDSRNCKGVLRNGFADYIWEGQKKTINKWKESSKYTTLNDWYGRVKRYCVSDKSHDIRYYEGKYPNDFVILVKESWADRIKKDMEFHLNERDGVIDNINHILREMTEKLFGSVKVSTLEIRAEDLSDVGHFEFYLTYPPKVFFQGLIRNIRQGLPARMDYNTVLTGYQKGICEKNFLESENEIKSSIREQADTYLAQTKKYDEVNQNLLDNTHAFVRKYVDSLTEYMIMEEFHVG